MINEIAMPTSRSSSSPYIFHSIFADDVALWCTHRSIDKAALGVQKALNDIAAWSQNWGLPISAQKSTSVVFTRSTLPMPRLHKPLIINDDEIPELSFHTFLGITLDCRLRFHIHAHRIKTKASKRLNILRAVSHTAWGGDRHTLL